MKKVAVFVDDANLQTGAYNNHANKMFDINDVLSIIKRYGRPVAMNAYITIKEEDNGGTIRKIKLFERKGFDAHIRPLSNGQKKDMDTYMAVDIVRCALETDVDIFIIVSGDSDYQPCLDVLKEKSKHIVLIGWSDSTSEHLKSRADEFIPYEKISKDLTPSPPLTRLKSTEASRTVIHNG